jgi:drug/metabolite transporter (DMT)-like permease
MRVGVQTLPPYAMAAMRFAIAGAVLWAYVRLAHRPLPTRREWVGAAIAGTLLLAIGNGLFAWAVQFIPAGIGSLFFCLSPVWMMIFGYVFFRERIPALGLAGIAVGISGMAYLLVPSLLQVRGTIHLPLLATLVGLLCAMSWGLGSVIGRRFASTDLMQTSAMQMLAASAVLIVATVATGEHVTPAQFTTPAILALSFLIFGGSVVGFSCYLWLVRTAPVTLTGTYAFVNPIVSIALGVVLLHEQLTAHTLVAASIVIAGVVLMVAAPKPARPANAPPGLRRH